MQLWKSKYVLCTAVCAAVLLLTAGCSEEKTPEDNAAAADTKSMQQTQSDVTKERAKSVETNIYYPRDDGMGLVAVRRTLRTEKDDKYTAAMKSLLAGTKEQGLTNVIPKKAKLRTVTVKNGIATVDFSRELQQNFSGGSTGEEMLIGSIVDTLTEFPEVERVRILIDGATVETLAGHMDLSEPLPRMTELLK